MTPPPPGMRYNLRRGFVDDGELSLEQVPEPITPAVADARHRAAVAGVVALGIYILIMVALAAYVTHAQWSTPAPAGSVVTPSTYGWPGPNGGPT